jgi:SAM-dependent methyltransferase
MSESNTQASVTNRIFYRTLLALSHHRNFRTEEELAGIEAAPQEEAIQVKRIQRFITYIEPHIDVRSKKVLDIGCGDGMLCIEFAKRGAGPVHGMDIDPNRIRGAQALANVKGLTNVVEFSCCDVLKDTNLGQKFDLVISKAAFEHIPDPHQCLRRIWELLEPGGYFATVFGPLWGSPYGAHMQGFTRVPWVHFLFPEDVVLRVRREKYRPDEAAARYEEIKGSLNRITVKQFKHYVSQTGFETVTIRLNPAQSSGIYGFVNKCINSVPVLQEIGSMQLLAILRRPPL